MSIQAVNFVYNAYPSFICNVIMWFFDSLTFTPLMLQENKDRV